MALTTRRKRPLDRRTRPEPHRDARLFVIATEGEKTEKQYFSMFHFGIIGIGELKDYLRDRGVTIC